MKVKFDHVGIIVKDLEKALKFFNDIFGWEQVKTGSFGRIFEVDKPGYKIRYAMVHARANDIYVELVEPKEGPWSEALEKHGEGSLRELCVVVDDIEEFYDKMKEMGITPLDRFLQPLVEEKYMVSPAGAKWMYLSGDKTLGILLEVVQRPLTFSNA